MANASIGKLSVQLTANTTPFQRAMTRAGATMRRIGSAAAKVGAAIGAVGAAGLAAAAGGLAALTKQQLAAGDELGKNADRLGVSTEALAGLQHASELAGVSQEALNKSLQRLNRSLGEAMEGTGPAAEALAVLGLSAEELAKIPADQAVGQIADKLNGLNTTAERSRVAFDLFGRSGIDLFTLFQGGSAGIEAARLEADRLGLTISRMDAAGLERANDAMARLRRVFTGIGRQVAVAVAPILERLSTRLQALATDGEGVGGKVRAAFAGIIEAAATMADGVDALREGLLYLKAAYLDFAASVIEALEKVGSKTATIASGIASALSPAAGSALAGMANVANAGLSGSARLLADRAATDAQVGLGGDAFGARIRRFGQTMLAPGVYEPPTKRDQDETTAAIEELRDEIREQTDELVTTLQKIGTGAVNAQLLRLLDRLALGVSGARPAVFAGAGAINGTRGFDTSGGQL